MLIWNGIEASLVLWYHIACGVRAVNSNTPNPFSKPATPKMLSKQINVFTDVISLQATIPWHIGSSTAFITESNAVRLNKPVKLGIMRTLVRHCQSNKSDPRRNTLFRVPDSGIRLTHSKL